MKIFLVGLKISSPDEEEIFQVKVLAFNEEEARVKVIKNDYDSEVQRVHIKTIRHINPADYPSENTTEIIGVSEVNE